MADDGHLNRLLQGRKACNAWMANVPGLDEIIDLRDAVLPDMDLEDPDDLGRLLRGDQY